jgi:methylmalonyl-CoA/ethylmalonyl-CoA epimerase
LENPLIRLSLHHVGLAVADLESASKRYVALYGYELCSTVIHDPVQTARVQFLRLPGDVSFLELVAPDGPHSKLTGSIGRGGGLNHLCYATDDIDQSFAELQVLDLMPLCAPVAAAAFPARRIAWLCGADRVPIELVERGPPGQL